VYHKQLLKIFEQTSVNKRKSTQIIYTVWEYKCVPSFTTPGYTIPIPNPIANPIPSVRGLAIAAPSYGGP